MISTPSPREILSKLNTYVPGKPIDEVKRELGFEKVIKLASNENPLGPAPLAVKALKEYAETVNLYPDGGFVDLRNELGNKLGIASNMLTIGNGSDELLMLIALAYIDSTAEVLISEQTFSEYVFTATIMESNIKKIPQIDFKYDLKGFLKNISDKTRIIYLCNPNNPTGTMFKDEEFRSFMNKVPRDIVVVVDEAYYEYVNDKDYPQTINYLEEYDNLTILRTFSKIYGLAGLRIGYCIANKGIIENLNKVREPFNVNLLAQKAAIAALNDQAYLIKVNKLNNKMKDFFYSELQNMGLKYIESKTNFVLFESPIPGAELFQKMLKKGIIIRAMDGFGLKNHVRVTTGTEEESKYFIETLKELIE